MALLALVAERGARVDIRPQADERFEMRCVRLLPAGEIEGEEVAVEVGLQMDLGREAAARAPERMAVLPPFAPAADTWARTTVESNICTSLAVLLKPASASKKASNTPDRRKRQNRFHTLFQLPNRSGSARQVTL